MWEVSLVMNRRWAKVTAGCLSRSLLMCAVSWIITASRLVSWNFLSNRPSLTLRINAQQNLLVSRWYVYLLVSQRLCQPSSTCLGGSCCLVSKVRCRWALVQDKVFPAGYVVWCIASAFLCSIGDAVAHMSPSQHTCHEVLGISYSSSVVFDACYVNLYSESDWELSRIPSSGDMDICLNLWETSLLFAISEPRT